MSKNNEVNKNENEQLSLNDDRRVKVLSPSALVAKRFFRNRLAVTGLVILIIMFFFSFIGGWFLTPYDEDEQFYRTDLQSKDYANAAVNKEMLYIENENAEFDPVAKAQSILYIGKQDSYEYNGVKYTINDDGDGLYSVSSGGKLLFACSKEFVDFSNSDAKAALNGKFDFKYQAVKTANKGGGSFNYDGKTYTVDENSVVYDGETEVASVGLYKIEASSTDIFLTRDFKNQLIENIEANNTVFKYTQTEKDEDGNEVQVEYEYDLVYDAYRDSWAVKQEKETTVFDTYSAPSAKHWLGTDRNGMDMMTRLMYGGQVSLVIGFLVVIIETVIGVILGGIAGYFGGWVDNLIMRIVDIFYCVPSMPIIIILGAMMDAQNTDPTLRMVYLMLILGFLGWPGIARLVRGQILSLREQEFMTATEACGVRVSRRIFKHLIPNVIPQLIVTCTMGLGSTIITEATLSFLGLGVRFPFASWGNIINDVNDTFVLTNYWFIWIPAGVLLLLTVLAFNIVGDGLRDAFDPKMKR